MALLFIIILSSSLLPFLNTFEIPSTPHQRESQQNLSIEHRKILDIVKLHDLDKNKIIDSSFQLNSRMKKLGRFSLMFSENSEYFQSKISSLGFTIKAIYENFNTAVIEGSFAEINGLLDLPEVLAVQESVNYRPFVSSSTIQMGVRPKVWDYGYNGSGNFNIAILDTGIDDSHPFFSEKIVEWKDFIGKDALFPSDIYFNPSDVDGHGTAVAGVALGYSISTQENTTESHSFNFPPSNNEILVSSIPYQNSSFTINLGIGYSTFADIVSANRIRIDIRATDGNTITTRFIQGSSSHMLDIPLNSGAYTIWVSGGISDEIFEFWMVKPKANYPISSHSQNNYSYYQGVAFQAGVVALKVLDDVGDGTTFIILKAIDWLIANKGRLNITVANLSLGGNLTDLPLDNAIRALTENGVIVVTAAGNDGPSSSQIFSPGSAKEAITVGAVNFANEIAVYSSKGDLTLNPTIKPDILAPGGSYTSPVFGDDTSYTQGLGIIYTADTNDRLNGRVKPDDFTGITGTSIASPHITGLALLLSEKMAEMGLWNEDFASVMKVKQAILSSAFEVANIGSNGGEQTLTGPDPMPELNRIGKDVYEGFGMVNGYGALSFFDNFVPYNVPLNLEFGLNDIFLPNNYVYRLSTASEIVLKISLDVPDTSDIDLILYEETPNSYGEPVVLLSSTNGSNIDEEILFTSQENKNYILNVKLANSISTKINATLRVDTNLTPSMHILTPIENGFYNQQNIPLEFDSSTGYGEVFINDTSYGYYKTGNELQTSLSDGKYVLKIVDSNSLSSLSASDSVYIFIDSTNPTITATNLTSTVISSEYFSINYSVSDNYGINEVQLFINNGIVNSSTAKNGVFIIYTDAIPYGNQTVEIRAIDNAMNYARESSEFHFTHSIYLLDLEPFVLEYQNFLSFVWEAAAKSPNVYSIKQNDEFTSLNSAWDGNPIKVEITPDGLKKYFFELSISDTNNKIITRNTSVTIVDSTTPIYSGNQPGSYDVNFNRLVQLTITDNFLHKINITSTIERDGFPVLQNNYIAMNLSQTSFTYNLSLVLGLVTVNLYAEDTSQNTLNEMLTYQVYDNILPNLTSSLDQTVSVQDSVNLTWMYSDYQMKNISIIFNDTLYNFTSNTENEGSYSIKFTPMVPGIFVFTALAVDTSGNVANKNITITAVEQTISNSSNSSELTEFTLTIWLVLVFSILLTMLTAIIIIGSSSKRRKRYN